MTSDDLAMLRALLIRHEGRRLQVYADSLGIPTIGVGRNLRDKGITPSECDLLLENDIADVLGALTHAFPWFTTLNAARQLALVDMTFNVGPGGLLKSPKMLAALAAGDYPTAVTEMLDGPWSTQVGQRAQDLAAIIRTGVLS